MIAAIDIDATSDFVFKSTGCDRLTLNGISNGTSGEFQRRREEGSPIPKVGEYSVTMLRHPFARALSACMYKVEYRKPKALAFF
jgi:uncharacterized protein YhfF